MNHVSHTKRILLQGLLCSGLVLQSSMPILAQPDNGHQEDGTGLYTTSNDSQSAEDWLYKNGHWYCLDAQGDKIKGWVQDGNQWYYLNRKGIMQTGWLHDAGHWYYLDPDGSMHTGWLQQGNSWYYLDAAGHMVKDCFLGLDDALYHFGNDGTMSRDTQIKADNGSANVYFDTTGACRSILPYDHTWQGGYMNTVEDYRDQARHKQEMRCALIEDSSHNVPWLWIDSPSRKDGSQLAAWNGSEAALVPTQSGAFTYAKGTPIVHISSSKADYSCDLLYSFSNGLWVQLAKGETLRSKTGKDTRYLWNGEALSESQYKKAYNQLVETPVQIRKETTETMSYNEILAALLNARS